jgi:hypothetical protein
MNRHEDIIYANQSYGQPIKQGYKTNCSWYLESYRTLESGTIIDTKVK